MASTNLHSLKGEGKVLQKKKKKKITSGVFTSALGTAGGGLESAAFWVGTNYETIPEKLFLPAKGKNHWNSHWFSGGEKTKQKQG